MQNNSEVPLTIEAFSKLEEVSREVEQEALFAFSLHLYREQTAGPSCM